MARVLEGRNRATADEAASFVDEFDRLEQERERKLDELDAEFKAKKRAINAKVNADQKSLLTDAKKVGVNKGVIRAIADPQKRKRKAQEAYERATDKAEEAIEALEQEDRDFAIDIRKALGDDFANLPLGAAAVEREEAEPKQDPATAAIVDAFAKGDAKPAKAAKH